MTAERVNHRIFTMITMGLLGLAGSMSTLAADVERTVTRQFDAGEGTVVEVLNIAGKYEISGITGNEIGVDVTIHAEDETLASKLEIEFDQQDGRLIVTAKYPLDEYSVYHYPAGENLWSGWGSETSSTYLGERVRVVGGPNRQAVKLYADFEIRLPHGSDITVKNLAGDVTAEDLRGELTADTGSGDVRASSGTGAVRVDSGSGDVIVTDYQGDVIVDTGSGDIEVTRAKGDLRADTGSGHIRLSATRARSVRADTGSGDIEASDIAVEESFEADTGSGDVVISGDLSQISDLVVDTGSGSVDISSKSFPPMELDIDTGSGRIDVDISNAEVIFEEDDMYRARIGGGDGARMRIDTGSGRVKVTDRN